MSLVYSHRVTGKGGKESVYMMSLDNFQEELVVSVCMKALDNFHTK